MRVFVLCAGMEVGLLDLCLCLTEHLGHLRLKACKRIVWYVESRRLGGVSPCWEDILSVLRLALAQLGGDNGC